MNVYLPYTAILPSEYQEVEYIESSGNGSSGQYINTGVLVSNNTKVVTKGYTTGYPLYGVGTAGSFQSISLLTLSNLYAGRFRSGSSSNATVTSSISGGTTVHTFEHSQTDGFYIDGTKIGTFTSYTFTETRNLYLFCWSNNNTATDFCTGRIYYMKIYNGGTLVRDFIPCYRVSDNVIGLFDKVENKFYTNSGTGTFSKGNDVTMTMLKNAYIGEVWTLEDSFSGTSLDTSKRAIDKIANIGTVTVNNSLILSTNGTGTGNAGGPVVKSVKTLNGTEKKITVLVTATATNGGCVSIGGYTFNWVSETSYYKCNGNLPIAGAYNNALNATKSSTSVPSGNSDAAQNSSFTSLGVPYTQRIELDLVNRIASAFNGNQTTALASLTIPSNVNFNDWIGKPVVTMSAIGWNSRNLTVTSINVTVE